MPSRLQASRRAARLNRQIARQIPAPQEPQSQPYSQILSQVQQVPPNNLTPAEVAAEVQRLQDEFAKDKNYPYTPAEARLLAEYYAPHVGAAIDNGNLPEVAGEEIAQKYGELEKTLSLREGMNTQEGQIVALRMAANLAAAAAGLGVQENELTSKYDLENEEDVKRLAGEYEKNPEYPWTDKQMQRLMEFYGPGMRGLVKNRELAKAVGPKAAVVTYASALTELTWRNANTGKGRPVYTKLAYDPNAVSPEVKKVLDEIHKDQDYIPTPTELRALAMQFGTEGQFQAIDDSIRRGVKTNAKLQEQQEGGVGSIPGYTQLSYDPLAVSPEVKKALDKIQKDPDYNPTPTELRALSMYFGADGQLQAKDDNIRRGTKTSQGVKEARKGRVGSIPGFTTLTYDPTTAAPEVKKILEKIEKDTTYAPTQTELRALEVHFGPEIQMCRDAGLKEAPGTVEECEELKQSAARKSAGAGNMERHEIWGPYRKVEYKHKPWKMVDTTFSLSHTERPKHLTMDEMVILNGLFNNCTPPIHRKNCEHLDEDGDPIEDETEKIFRLTDEECAMFVEGYKKLAKKPVEEDEVLEGRLKRMMRGFVEIGGDFYQELVEDGDEDEEDGEDEEDVNGEPYDSE